MHVTVSIDVTVYMLQMMICVTYTSRVHDSTAVWHRHAA